MKKFVVLWFLFIELLLVSFPNAFAASQLKIICDIDGENVYVDGKFKTTCYADDPVLILVPPGKHVIKVKKFNKDGSYYYFKKVVEIGDGVRVTVGVNSEKRYTERYYYSRAKKSGKPEDYWEYLKRYPHGKYAKEVRRILKGFKGLLVEAWDRTFGGKDWDEAESIIQTKDGGYVVAGYTWSKGAGSKDVWVIKLDKDGNKVWDRTFGGYHPDEADSIVQARDGGYVVAGWTESKGAGKADVWVIKLDKDGNKVWDRTFGGGNDDRAYSIIQTKDGGYVVAGYTESRGAGKADVWVIKLDKDGNKVWDRTFGGYHPDEADSIVQARDGGYVVAGWTESKGAGRADAWVIKLDENGNKVWDKTFGGKDWDEAKSIIQTKDGGYVVAGYTESRGAGRADAWVIKLDENGNKVWDKTFGGKDWDEAKSIIQTKDGGYVVAGYTESRGTGRADAWVIKLDENGNKAWDKTFGSWDDDFAESIIQVKDGGYVVAGYTRSKGAGKADVWVIKLVLFR